MTRIESERGVLNAPSNKVYEELSNLNNLEKYLPKEKISNWESTHSSCSFKVLGTYTIGLEIAEDSSENLLKYKATDKSPFPFTLSIHLNETESQQTDSQIVCEAKLNPMLKMMVVKPLKNLFDHIVKKASEHYS